MDKEMQDKINAAMMANGMQELNMDELDKVGGGWEDSQLTPEELREYKELREAFFKAYEDHDRDRFGEIGAKMRAFGDRMIAKYGPSL